MNLFKKVNLKKITITLASVAVFGVFGALAFDSITGTSVVDVVSAKTNKAKYEAYPVSDNMDEEETMRVIHYMVHQKVITDDNEKWGFVPMTKENISHIRKSMQNHPDKFFVYQEFINDTLDNWEQGDFSDSVEVHNFIWNNNSGTIGAAHATATERQEKMYLESQGYTGKYIHNK